MTSRRTNRALSTTRRWTAGILLATTLAAGGLGLHLADAYASTSAASTPTSSSATTSTSSGSTSSTSSTSSGFSSTSSVNSSANSASTTTKGS